MTVLASSEERLPGELMRAVKERKTNTHHYVIWLWTTRPYSECLLTITHPFSWKVVGTLTWHYIPWANMRTGTSPLGASLSWVDTPYFVHDVLQDGSLWEGVIQSLTAVVQQYFAMDNDPNITLQDRFSGLRPYSLDSITEEVYKDIFRLVSREKGHEFLQIYLRPDEDIKVHILSEIPFEGMSLVDDNDVVRFPTESTICVEASTRGLRYLIFFFDKLPSCVCEFHLIKFEDEQFNDFDYVLASYFIRKLQVNPNLLRLEKLQNSRKAPTLAAGWHSIMAQTFSF